MSAKKVDLDADERPKLEIKIPGLVGGAAASVVAALIGSRLGIQGTLIGAAASSVVFGLASPFVTFSIEKSHHGLRAVTRRSDADQPAPAGTATDADADQPAPTDASATDAATDAAAAAVGATVAPEPTPVRRRLPLGLALAGMLLTALATFGATLGVLTVTEAGTGRSVDGGYTSTVGGLASGGKATAESRSATSSLRDEIAPDNPSDEAMSEPTSAAVAPQAPSAEPATPEPPQAQDASVASAEPTAADMMAPDTAGSGAAQTEPTAAPASPEPTQAVAAPTAEPAVASPVAAKKTVAPATGGTTQPVAVEPTSAATPAA